MEENHVIQVSLQLPADAVYGFTNMVRQLRYLVEETRGIGPNGEDRESMESSAFDEERYQAILQQSATARSVQVDIVSASEAARAFQQIRRQVQEPELAGEDMPSAPPEDEPASAGQLHQQEIQAPQEAARPPRQDAEPAEDIPAVQAAADTPLEDAPLAELEPESGMPEAEAVWAEVAERQGGESADAPAESPTALETPQRAGVEMAAGAEAAQSRWGGVTEELTAPGPAPLTAEAVSLAFRRDGRRYDNGFPLY